MSSPLKEPSPIQRLLPKASSDESDLNTFLDAIGSMEKVFKDEWCGDVPDKRAVPRRMKQVERGQLKPEDELDLHGMTVDEATDKVLSFCRTPSSRVSVPSS